MSSLLSMPTKSRVISFVWQHILLLFSLYLMTLGVTLCIKSDLGSSVISSLPLSLSTAGNVGSHLAWFDRLLNYRPGFRRYIFGLAKFIYRRNNK